MKVLIAGGGTGGHFFSGVAVGEAFLTRNRANVIVYVGTRQGIEARVAAREGLDVRFVSVSGLKGKGILSRLLGLLRLPIAMLQSFVLLLRERPQIVIGVGGYASGPVVLVARLLGRITGIVEQNSVAGLTNRLLGRIVHRVFIAFEPARRDFPAHKVELTGNPVRERVMQLLTLESTGTVGVGARLKLLVLGGSQGAHALNAAMVGAVRAMSEEGRARLHVTHQSGAADEEMVRAGYLDAGVDAVVSSFIVDMASAYRFADLVLCRAGAMTVSELMISRRGSVLVPFPHAIYDHQTVNARVLVDAGGAELLPEAELTPERLALTLDRLGRSGKQLQLMASKAGELARPEAAAEVVDTMYRLAGVP